MKSTRICPVCGAVFEPTAPRQKYCCTACRRAGTAVTRATWMNKSNHREKDRLRHRERRAEERQARTDQEAKARERRTNEAVERLKDIQTAFNERCEAGDSRALLLREKGASGNSSVRHWELFAAVELAEAERSGKISKTTVNGISVYSDNFGAEVMESIRERGHVIIRAF